jgi:peptidoglycan hydrolase CwlO-like protein
MDLERIAKLETQVEGIKEDVADVKSDIKELHSRITTTTREITDHIDKKIDILAAADKQQHEDMSKTMKEIKSRVEILERWRFMIVGGAVALGYLVGNMEFFSKFFK